MQHQDFELDATIHRLLTRTGGTADAATVEEYRKVAQSFGPDFTVCDISEGPRFRMADNLVCVGVLERNIETFFDGTQMVRRVEFRRRVCQLVQVAA